MKLTPWFSGDQKPVRKGKELPCKIGEWSLDQTDESPPTAMLMLTATASQHLNPVEKIVPLPLGWR